MKKIPYVKSPSPLSSLRWGEGRRVRGIVIAAGGTGGHLLPALALAQKFRTIGVEVLVMGRTTETLRNEFLKNSVPFREIPVVRLPEKKTGFFLLPFRAIRALFSTLGYMLRFRPLAVIGMGGYASAGPAAAAVILRLPLYFCEQNLLPGKVTRFFGRLSHTVFTSFPETSRYLRTKKILEFGNPLRPFPEKEKKKKTARQKLNIDEEKFTVLVIGGSQGAHRLNLKVGESLDYLSPGEVQFIHLTGCADLPEIAEIYRRKKFRSYLKSFFSEMGLLYSAVDLVICRAGATTIAELNLFGLPSILIPYPFAAEDHQRFNAKFLADNGAAIMREESSLTGETLAGEIKMLINDRQRLGLMAQASQHLSHPKAAEHIVSFILSDLAPHPPLSPLGRG